MQSWSSCYRAFETTSLLSTNVVRSNSSLQYLYKILPHHIVTARTCCSLSASLSTLFFSFAASVLFLSGPPSFSSQCLHPLHTLCVSDSPFPQQHSQICSTAQGINQAGRQHESHAAALLARLLTCLPLFTCTGLSCVCVSGLSSATWQWLCRGCKGEVKRWGVGMASCQSWPVPGSP